MAIDFVDTLAERSDDFVTVDFTTVIYVKLEVTAYFPCSILNV